MDLRPCVFPALVTLAALGLPSVANADTTTARCDVYPKGSDTASSYGPCTFSQRQGYVTIALQDGTTYELSPDPNQADAFVDQEGRPGTIEDGLGEAGLIYRLADISIFVYWQGDSSSGTSSAYSEPRRGGGSVPCSSYQPTYEDMCQANTVFGDPGNSSITLMGTTGNEHHLAYYNGALHSTDPGDEVLVQVLNGEYFISINDEEFFRLDEIIVTGVD